MRSRPTAPRVGRTLRAALACLGTVVSFPAVAEEVTVTGPAPLLAADGAWTPRVRLSGGDTPAGRVASVSWLWAYRGGLPVEAEICVGRRCLVTDAPETYGDRTVAGAPSGPVTVRFRTTRTAKGAGTLVGDPVRVTIDVER